MEEEEYPLLDAEGENLEAFVYIPVRSRPEAGFLTPEQIKKRKLATLVGFAIGVGLALLCIFA